MLTEEQAKEYYIQHIEDYCNVIFDRNNLPGGVQLALERCMALDPHQIMIGSQKLHDMSITYADPTVVTDLIRKDLEPYCRPHLVGNNKKRRYRDGR